MNKKQKKKIIHMWLHEGTSALLIAECEHIDTFIVWKIIREHFIALEKKLKKLEKK